MTSPHATATGVYHCPVLYMAHETGLTLEGASKALRRLIDEAFCEYDDASETVFVINMAAHQIAERLDPKDKRIPWLRKELEKMPTSLKHRFLQVHGDVFHLLYKQKPASPSEAPPKPLRSQDQDQDQDQEQEQEQDQEHEALRARRVESMLPAGKQPTPEGAMAVELRKRDISVTSMHPTLVNWVKDGFTVEQVCEAVELARKTPGKEAGSIPANYLDRILRQPARPPPAPAAARLTWRPPDDDGPNGCTPQNSTPSNKH